MEGRERSLFLTDENMALATDLYEVTMAAGYLQADMNQQASFELFVRSLPAHRSFLLVAGLEQVVHYVRNLHFSAEAIDYLRSQPVFESVSDGFFDYLRELRFRGSVDAMPEGTVAFADEPLLRVTAPMADAQIVETYLLSTINFQTMVATKAARVVEAAEGRGVVDFGSRRAHGPQAGVLAARAAYIGGCAGTSNVLAGQQLGIRIFGTQAHSWVMAFPTESEAFTAYHKAFPDHTILLLDTYDTIEAARKAARFGPGLAGVRLDSGDLAALSKQVRAILDQAGMGDTRIVASGDLNEYRIADVLAQGVAIDAFGVGTELVTSKDAPSLGGVYKLVEQHIGGQPVPRLKLSTDKETYPGRKQVRRLADAQGRFQGDAIGTTDEEGDGEPLLVPILREGRLVGPLPSLEAIRERAAESLRRLPPRFRRLDGPDAYPVRHSRRLHGLRSEVLRELEEQGEPV
ncbi:MAG: nicotinate phosphoribosyltransferase [Candidatus Brocadiia bacterium]